MSIQDKILKVLLEPKHRYFGVPMSTLGIPSLFPYKKQSIANALAQLKNKKYIVREGGDKIMIMPSGQKYIESKTQRLKLFNSPFAKNSPKNLLVLFDIPEDHKAEREWFRHHLKQFGYTMIQRSVWLDPSPLPKTFVDYVKSIGLKNCIKTFKIANPKKITF